MPTRTIAVQTPETPETAEEPEPQPPDAAAARSERRAEPEPARSSSGLKDKIVTALIGVVATLLVGALAFVVNDFDSDIRKLDAKFGELDAKIDTKVGELDVKIERLDDKVDEIAVMLTSLVARLEESGTVGAAGP